MTTKQIQMSAIIQLLISNGETSVEKDTLISPMYLATWMRPRKARHQQLCVGKIMSPTMIRRVHPRLRTENILVFRICVNENTYEKNIKHTEHLWS